MLNHIKNHFDIKDPQHIGMIKEAVREVILEGQIPNELEAALKLAVEIAAKLGVSVKSQ